MGNIISKVVGNAIKKNVKEAIGGHPMSAQEPQEASPSEELLQSGVKAHKARSKANTKPEADMSDGNSLFEELIPVDKPEEPVKQEKKMKTADDVSEEMLERAKRENLEEPDFDFRTKYEKGQKLWFVRYSKKLGNKELVEFHVRTIYARMVIGSQPKSICHCVGVNMRHQLFEDKKLATEFYNSLNLTPEEDTKPSKKHNGKEEYEEDGDVETNAPSLEELEGLSDNE